jgi:hypothetical protein
MILQLSPQELLVLYKAVLSSKELSASSEVTAKIENILLDSLEESWQKNLTTGFDKWVKSETNKIQGLEDELKKIKETIPREDLVKRFVPVKQNRQKGRPKKVK